MQSTNHIGSQDRTLAGSTCVSLKSLLWNHGFTVGEGDTHFNSRAFCSSLLLSGLLLRLQSSDLYPVLRSGNALWQNVLFVCIAWISSIIPVSYTTNGFDFSFT